MLRRNEPTILIVGGGIFGTSTAHHLALAFHDPTKITILDRTPSPPAPAASTDINKIIRADYTSPFYCGLAYEALHAWAIWPELKSFYHRTGWIMLDEEGSDVSDRVRKVFRERGHDPTEDIPLDELDSRWKGILKGTATDGFKEAYFNPEAGWCDAASATASLMNAAIDRGAKYVTGDVVELVLKDGRVEGVRTKDGGTLSADLVVLATGAWTSSIMSPVEDTLEIPESDRLERQASAAGVGVAHFKMSSAEMTRLSEMPVVVYGGCGEVIPPPEANQLLKYTNASTFTNVLITPTGHHISIPPERDQHIVPEALKRETEDRMMSKVMPSFAQGKTADYWRLCWDARTPTRDWLLTKHPDARLGNLFFAIGGSFHSYKFLPTAGKYMLNVLTGDGNGAEKDKAWGWKDANANWRGAHEKTAPTRDLKTLE